MRHGYETGNQRELGVWYFLYKRSSLGISLCRRQYLWGRRVGCPLWCHQQQMVWGINYKWAKLRKDQILFTDVSAHPKWELAPGALPSGITNAFCLQ